MLPWSSNFNCLLVPCMTSIITEPMASCATIYATDHDPDTISSNWGNYHLDAIDTTSLPGSLAESSWIAMFAWQTTAILAQIAECMCVVMRAWLASEALCTSVVAVSQQRCLAHPRVLTSFNGLNVMQRLTENCRMGRLERWDEWLEDEWWKDTMVLSRKQSQTKVDLVMTGSRSDDRGEVSWCNDWCWKKQVDTLRKKSLANLAMIRRASAYLPSNRIVLYND